MNKVYLQLWEESSQSEDFLSDGCSLHIDLTEREKYINHIYDSRSEIVPDKYDRMIGDYIEVFISDSLFDKIKQEKSVKLPEPSFQNLLKFEEIIYNYSEI